MPGRDQTGPNGTGAMTGRRMGVCSGVNAQFAGRGSGRGIGCGLGLGLGRAGGIGRRPGLSRAATLSTEERQAQLQNEVEMLREELAMAEARLGKTMDK